ncbi:MAG: YbfB/YjiJ family MFS transporter [Alphaproteobacteria bacterium]|nr:MAG: YbfB/YjiJ family MFS transporter [Alphaproteobacteria bacterium]
MPTALKPGQKDTASPISTPWRGIFSAFCTCLIGIGLARLAYTPLIPAIIEAHWFDASLAAYLGAANLAGYLTGALFGRKIAAHLSTTWTLRLMMLAASAAFFACAFPLDFLWFFFWRFTAGAAGGALMVLAAPTILPHIPIERRGVAGGIIFIGAGTGVVVSGVLVPLLLKIGLQETWVGLGLASLLLTLAGWTGWPRDKITLPLPASHIRVPKAGMLRALYAEYALNAAGWVPHMIFLVAFVARGMGMGVETGAIYWVLFGLGATVGPVFSGYLADRVGFGKALRIAFFLEAMAVALPAFGLGAAALAISSIVVGAFVSGTVSLVLGRITELLPHHPARQKSAWSLATASFALAQAASAYGFSYIFSESGENYELLFLIGSGAMVLALVIDIVTALTFNRMPPHGDADKSDL